jgi:hypothetical protein
MENRSLLLTRDSVADVAYLYLRHPVIRGDIARSEVADIETPPRSSIILSFDEYDRLIAVEILGASRLLPPELL